MGKGVGSSIKAALKKAMAESVARSAARAGRPTPAKAGTVARAGGYASPIDTAGVDASMKRTLGLRDSVKVDSAKTKADSSKVRRRSK